MKVFYGLGLMALASVCPALGDDVGPMYSRHRLIAGAGDAGFRDGSFVRAAFDHPAGLAVSDDGAEVYVADAGNHAVRCIYLAEQNRVATECGDGSAGDVDSLGGTLAARLERPTDLAMTRDKARLYIYDREARKIKVWDRAGKVLSTVFSLSGTPETSDQSVGLLLSAQESHLAFLDSEDGSLDVGDIKAGTLRQVLHDPLFAAAGTHLAYSAGHLRFYSEATHQFFAVLAAGRELDSAGLQSLSEGAQVSLQLRSDTAPGWQGFTGMGEGPTHQGVMSWDADYGCFRLLENPLSAVLGMPNSEGIPGVALLTATSKAFIKGPLSLAYDPARFVIYISEQGSNRVAAVRDDSQVSLSHALWFNHDYPRQKPVGVTRILMYGCSREFHSNEESEEIGMYMSTQFEQALNVLSSLRGDGRQFEVLHDFYRGRVIGAGEIFAMLHPEIPKDYHVDYVLLPMDVESLWWDISAWDQVETKDDVPLRTEDAEWAARGAKEKVAAMGPLTKAMVAFCKGNPKDCADRINFSADGLPTFSFRGGTPMSFFAQPRLAELAMGVEGKIGAK